MSHSLPPRDLSRKEQVELIENIINKIEILGEYAIYVLKCDLPKSDEEIIRRLDDPYGLTNEESHDVEWTQRVLYADELYYVGQTNDLQRRLLEHVRGGATSALITTEFPPIEVTDVEWTATRKQAAEREKERSREIDDRELTRALSRDPIPVDSFYSRLNRLMKMSAEWYLEDYDPPRKKHVFEEWREKFLESFEAWGATLSPPTRSGERWIPSIHHPIQRNPSKRSANLLSTGINY